MRSVSVAESGGTIDPNDLDSIDALLDEAEWEAAEEEEASTVDEMSEADSDNPNESLDNAADSDALDNIPEDIEDDTQVDSDEEAEQEGDTPDEGLDNLEDMDDGLDATTESALEPEPEPKPKPESETPSSVEEQQPPEEAAEKPAEIPIAEDHAEQFLQKRASVKQKEPSNLTVAEMDSIKKLIITFSSTIIFLVVVGLGIGLWGALSSNSSLDEETMTLLKDTHEGSMQSMVKSVAAEDAVKQVGKKLDALSFQLEQLNSDLLEMKDAEAVAPNTAKSPGVLNLKNEQTPQKVQAAAPNVATETTQVVMDAGVGKKIDKVNAQVVVTQRRLAEVNNRVKRLQTQYQTFLKSLKELEKAQLKGQSNITDLLEATKAKVHADKVKQQAMEKSRYEYSAPNSPFFDYVR